MNGNGVAWNKGRCSWIVKRREREQWTTQTIKGPRRVWRMGKWRVFSGSYCGSLFSAVRLYEKSKKIGLWEYAVFHKGRRLNERELAEALIVTKASSS